MLISLLGPMLYDKPETKDEDDNNDENYDDERRWKLIDIDVYSTKRASGSDDQIKAEGNREGKGLVSYIQGWVIMDNLNPSSAGEEKE